MEVEDKKGEYLIWVLYLEGFNFRFVKLLLNEFLDI